MLGGCGLCVVAVAREHLSPRRPRPLAVPNAVHRVDLVVQRLHHDHSKIELGRVAKARCDLVTTSDRLLVSPGFQQGGAARKKRVRLAETCLGLLSLTTSRHDSVVPRAIDLSAQLGDPALSRASAEAVDA